ncbi:ribosome maturation factor RimM [Vibrio sp. SS-MA-C1-2]|uniref:ribosome maturation factor RimM n=1 Tax=Vibrio sp. SS-MA-C1-2 TaxID=2908646 RepID=UPI001EEBF5AE|nr:ribosome maturation factor RimM [Vibrio sp. SS-MA-C1-2]UJF18944.1 ribosome maturation factor RimM [Vibrio sp. SS-MA-C1-2]
MGVETNKQQDDKIIVVGKLGASYGIRGWLKVFSYTEVPESIFSYKPWLLKVKGEWIEFPVEDWKRHNQGHVCKLQSVGIREEAQAYANVEIGVYGDQLPNLPEEEFYWKDLFGMSVVTTKGYDLGKVDDIFETGSNDVLVVKANLKDAFGKKERLVPFLEEQVIKHIDAEARRIEVDWDPGF